MAPGTIEQLAERLGLDLSRPVRTLSKGNKQKLGLVQAFMHRPDLLVLDEPTSGLDPLVQREFLAMVREARDAGQTVLLSSHVLSEIQQAADEVAVLADGRVVADGPVSSLRIASVRRLRATVTDVAAETVREALESALALLLKLAVLGIVAWLLIWAVDPAAELDLDPGNLTAAIAAWVGLGLIAGTAAFAAGAVTGRRSWGIAVGAGVAVVGYVLQAVANNSDELDGLRVFSPFHWAYGQTPLSDGVDWPGLGLLWGGSALLIAITAAALARRDIVG